MRCPARTGMPGHEIRRMKAGRGGETSGFARGAAHQRVQKPQQYVAPDRAEACRQAIFMRQDEAVQLDELGDAGTG